MLAAGVLSAGETWKARWIGKQECRSGTNSWLAFKKKVNVADVPDRMRKYLHEVWKLDENGIPVYRTGDWDWPDADSPVDKLALMPCLYYLALKSELEFAGMLGRLDDVAMIESVMSRLKDSYNSQCEFI